MIVGKLPLLGMGPGRILEFRPEKVRFRRGGIVVLQELRVVAHGPDLPVSGVGMREKRGIAAQEERAVRFQVAEQAVLQIAAHPDAVDQPLIQRVHRQHIPARPQEGRDIRLQIPEPLRIGGSGALAHKPAVEIRLERIVRRDEQARPLRLPIQPKRAAEQDVAVSVRGAVERERLKLAVKHMPRAQRSELPVRDPAAAEHMHRFFRFAFQCCSSF